jgi:hypothetical protein
MPRFAPSDTASGPVAEEPAAIYIYAAIYTLYIRARADLMRCGACVQVQAACYKKINYNYNYNCNKSKSKK